MKKTITVAGVALMALLLSASACQPEANKDAPRINIDDESPALVLRMPDGFSNVATKCIPGTGIRVSVIYHASNSIEYSNYGSVSTVVDETCRK